MTKRLTKRETAALRSEKDIEEAADAYRSGADLRELALRYQTSPQTVGRRLVAHGVKLRGRAKTSKQRARLRESKRLDLDLDAIRSMAGSHSTAEIAAVLGCSAEAVRDRMIEEGIPRLPPKARMEHNYFWAGGRTIDKQGYVLLKNPNHPNATSGGYVREHRLVMEEALGRYLRPGEVVHHRDGDPGNNELSNLRLFASNGEHLRHELQGRRRLGAFGPFASRNE